MTRHLLKLSHEGNVLLATLKTRGSLVERRALTPESTWEGKWGKSRSQLTIEVGEYVLTVPVATGDGPWVGQERTPDARTSTRFTVARTGFLDGQNRWGLAKVFGDARIYLAELEPGGDLTEYPLIEGALHDPWSGKWKLSSVGLEVRVGDYHWIGSPDGRFPGLYVGEETGPQGTRLLTCVTYRIRGAEASNAMRAAFESPIARASAELLGAAVKGLLS